MSHIVESCPDQAEQWSISVHSADDADITLQLSTDVNRIHKEKN